MCDAPLRLRPSDDVRWDLVSLGEIMLRLDPGEGRIATARRFDVWEGGGEYNVARGLRRCFGLRTSVVTALADNPVGRLVEDLVHQGAVDTSHIRWVPHDGMGRAVRNGLNFTERGFGVRAALGCYDRGATAVSQLRAGDIDWTSIFEREGARWFHTGGIFAALSETTADVAEEAMRAARAAGVVVSYDLNYRPSLWRDVGGQERAIEVNRRLVGLVDVLFGNEEDLSSALGYTIDGVDESYSDLDTSSYASTLHQVVADFPNLAVIATSLRVVRTATSNGWGGICFADGEILQVPGFPELEILDRVGGGDSFASGLIYGLLSGDELQVALEYAVAHGALAMTTPGDNSMASVAEVQRLAAGGSARVQR
jgi:2-dehydro-3-deoxygluconokinase